MTRTRPPARVFLLPALLALLLAGLSLGGPAQAGEADVPLPRVPKGKGEKCVEDTDVMRRRHMEFLFHERDATVREGVRGTKYSLKECVACHATPDPQVAGGTVRTAREFCNACHAYAAVRIDCFACHTDRPEDQTGTVRPPAPALAGAAWTPLVAESPVP